MANLNELANLAKREIIAGDRAQKNRDMHYLKAGRALVTAQRKLKDGGKWLLWLKQHSISNQRAYELIALAKGKKTLQEQRDRKAESMRQTRAKLPPRGGSSKRQRVENACDFDWENMKPEDFGDADTSYKRQAVFYAQQATFYADAYPLKQVSVAKITQREIQAVRNVARAWSELADQLAQRIIRKVA